LFEDQLELMLELPGELPLPRILRGSTRARRAARAVAAAGLSLSEDLPNHARKHAILRPWRSPQIDPRLAQL